MQAAVFVKTAKSNDELREARKQVQGGKGCARRTGAGLVGYDGAPDVTVTDPKIRPYADWCAAFRATNACLNDGDAVDSAKVLGVDRRATFA